MTLPHLSSVLSWLSSTLSVRARIALLALSPVVGFAIISIAYLSGERVVESAFDSVKSSASLADASGDFKDALVTMQMTARDYAARPYATASKIFDDAYALAEAKLGTIEILKGVTDAKELAPIEATLTRLKSNFAELVQEHEKLGFEELHGVRGRLLETVHTLERFLNEDMSWIREVDALNLSISLAQMRRHQADYILRRDLEVRDRFFAEMDKFNNILDKIIGAEVLKDQIRQAAKAYGEALREWSTSISNIESRVAAIVSDTQLLIRVADDIVASSYQRRDTATELLAASQGWTTIVIIFVALAVAGLGFALSWLIGLSITLPLAGLAQAMRRLADGDTAAETRRSARCGRRRGG